MWFATLIVLFAATEAPPAPHAEARPPAVEQPATAEHARPAEAHAEPLAAEPPHAEAPSAPAKAKPARPRASSMPRVAFVSLVAVVALVNFALGFATRQVLLRLND